MGDCRLLGIKHTQQAGLRMHAKTNTSESGKQAGRYSSSAISRALTVLRMVADHPEGITLADLCRLTKLPKNSVFRILVTLEEEGVFLRNVASQQFTMTGQLLALAHRGTGVEILSQTLLERMRQLRDKTGETVLFGKLLGGHGVVLEQIPGSHPVKVQVEIGTRFTLHTAAPAKAIFACLPSEELRSYCQKMEFRRHTDTTITSADAFLAEIERVKKSGIAFDRGEEITDIRCCAAAILDHRKSPVGSIWVTGPTSRLSSKILSAIGREVLQTARAVSRGLGGL